MGYLHQLRFFNLSHNQITNLVPDIAKLQNLEYLDLRYNQLSILPEEISGMQSLRTLYLGGNPISKREIVKAATLLPRARIKF